MENRCVICGAIIPEGLQVCINCEKEYLVNNRKSGINKELLWQKKRIQEAVNLKKALKTPGKN